MYLSLIIPAYNEERRITATLLAVDRHLTRQSYAYEIIVADDGSVDETASLVQRLTGMVRHLRLLPADCHRGRGAAVRRGLAAAAGAVRVVMDADNSASIAHVDRVKPLFDHGAVVVVGTRSRWDHPEARVLVPPPLLRRIRDGVGSLWIQSVGGLWGFWDIQCGFAAFSEDAARHIVRCSRTEGRGFEAEALVIVQSAFSRSVSVVPVEWVNDPRSSMSWGEFWHMLREVAAVRWNDWRGVYRQC